MYATITTALTAAAAAVLFARLTVIVIRDTRTTRGYIQRVNQRTGRTAEDFYWQQHRADTARLAQLLFERRTGVPAFAARREVTI